MDSDLFLGIDGEGFCSEGRMNPCPSIRESRLALEMNHVEIFFYSSSLLQTFPL
jgi:hypothetical protein